MPLRNSPQTARRKQQAKGKHSALANRASSAEDYNIAQEHREDAPPGWATVQDKVAASHGLSVLLVEGHQPPSLVVSNNNSICNAFQSSRNMPGSSILLR